MRLCRFFPYLWHRNWWLVWFIGLLESLFSVLFDALSCLQPGCLTLCVCCIQQWVSIISSESTKETWNVLEWVPSYIIVLFTFGQLTGSLERECSAHWLKVRQKSGGADVFWNIFSHTCSINLVLSVSENSWKKWKWRSKEWWVLSLCAPIGKLRSVTQMSTTR